MSDIQLVVSEETINRIILLMMVKNEARIIERAIRSALPIADAVCLVDTGSTDDTIAKARSVCESAAKPFHCAEHTWKNFGHNRTLSFQAAQEFVATLGWPAASTWGLLLDGDMELRPEPGFNKQTHLTEMGHTLRQSHGTLEYNNVRLVRLSHPWTCIGATHEYWDGGPSTHIDATLLWIRDHGDGGSKADKFERDIRLLTESITEDPTNARAHFYLAQSYQNCGKPREAIPFYTKRIELGGWWEEIWYSKYALAQCYLAIGQPAEAELWVTRALESNKARAEPAYLMCKYFRETSQHYKAYHYYQLGVRIQKPSSGLFVELAPYDYLFDYERTVLDYYVHPGDHRESLRNLVGYLNKCGGHEQNVFSNMKFYVPKLKENPRAVLEDLRVKPIGDYSPSSSSLVKQGDRWLLNVRYVNYQIDAGGYYHIKDGDGKIRTRNYLTYLDPTTWQPTTPPIPWADRLPNCCIYENRIVGLEDVRLFHHGGGLRFTATQREYDPEGRNRIAFGCLDPATLTVSADAVLEPPQPSECEKNWIPVSTGDTLQWIYGWHPLRLGTVDETNRPVPSDDRHCDANDGVPRTPRNTLQITESYPTPPFWNRMRGSSPPFEYEGRLWMVTHLVEYSQPRVYYHCLVTIDATTHKPLSYSTPFVFCDHKIEYCIGFAIDGPTAIFTFSRNDSNPGILRIPLASIDMLNC